MVKNNLYDEKTSKTSFKKGDKVKIFAPSGSDVNIYDKKIGKVQSLIKGDGKQVVDVYRVNFKDKSFNNFQKEELIKLK